MNHRDATAYSSRLLALAYAMGAPLYDLIVWWGFLPLGGERRCRRELARLLRLEPAMRVASLCCGTGSMERAMLAEQPDLEITGMDIGRGQIARARKKVRGPAVTYIVGDAAATGLPGGGFDRVVIGLALHEMWRPARLAVLREARRLCAPGGLVAAIEHGRPATRGSRLLRALWWFFWIPGNPEVRTSRDLQRHGLDNEMRVCGLEVVEHHVTRPDWIGAYLAAPGPGAQLDARHSLTRAGPPA